MNLKLAAFLLVVALGAIVFLSFLPNPGAVPCR